MRGISHQIIASPTTYSQVKAGLLQVNHKSVQIQLHVHYTILCNKHTSQLQLEQIKKTSATEMGFKVVWSLFTLVGQADMKGKASYTHAPVSLLAV